MDVKNTLGDTWMIPQEAIGKPCLLVASDEARQTCYFGIFIAHPANLTTGQNQDKKLSVSAAGYKHIHWLVFNEPYPPGFWSRIGSAKTHAIMRAKTGNDRVSALFQEVQATPIHRDIIHAVAQQKDYMKRLRKNGGARDALAAAGIAILSGKYDAALIQRLGLGLLGPDEFISFRAQTPDDAAMLRAADKIL